MRLAIVEGADAGWRGEAVADHIGVVLADGREFWCGDDFTGVVIAGTNDDKLARLLPRDRPTVDVPMARPARIPNQPRS